ncbi:MAG TPA: TatD family hydrolase [Actinomycetota bacterium]|nr:TatD family hydrolase [Actinomycetota bacterium]
MQSTAVDSHCHLFLMDQEPAVAVEAAKAARVERMICVGVDVATSERSIAIASELEGVRASAGVHPHDADGFDDEAAARIETLLKDPAVVGVGECGLDWFRMHSEREAQLRTLAAHIELARDCGKPMIVHVRDAWDDALRVLHEGSAERVVIHCFTGDADIARECERRGYWLSFAGNVTYPKNAHMREAAAAVSLDRVLVETDSPFLAPQKLRGTDNSPQNVVITLAELASVRDEPLELLADATVSNAEAVFSGL